MVFMFIKDCIYVGHTTYEFILIYKSSVATCAIPNEYYLYFEYCYGIIWVSYYGPRLSDQGQLFQQETRSSFRSDFIMFDYLRCRF